MSSTGAAGAANAAQRRRGAMREPLGRVLHDLRPILLVVVPQQQVLFEGQIVLHPVQGAQQLAELLLDAEGRVCSRVATSAITHTGSATCNATTYTAPWGLITQWQPHTVARTKQG